MGKRRSAASPSRLLMELRTLCGVRPLSSGTILAGQQRRLLTGGMPRMMKLEFVAGAMIAAAPVVVGRNRESNQSVMPASRGRATEESPDSKGCGGG